MLAFDIATTDDSASWSATQLGTTADSGTVAAGQTRTVRQQVPLQAGELTLAFDADAEIAVDNVRVVGAADDGGSAGGAGGVLAPSAGPLSSADATAGRSWATGAVHGLFEIAFVTLQWGSLIAVLIGAGLVGYSRSQCRTTRGQTLVLGGVVGMVLTLGFPMVLSTAGWLATGSTATAPLDDPALAAPAVTYDEDFTARTLAATGWQPRGDEGSVFLANESGDRKLRVVSDGATVERTIPIERGGALPRATLTLDATVASSVGMQPPDRDSLNVTVGPGAKTVVDDEAPVTASGGDTTTATATRQFDLVAPNVTIRLQAVDLNGADGTVDVAIDGIEIRSAVAG
jgi:hypothetical protein